MQDSKVIVFLRNFPAWIVLFALTLIFVMLYKVSGDGSYKEWTSLVLASLFTALGIQRQQAPTQSANTTSGDVIVSSPTDELKDLTQPEAIGAVEQIKEEK